MRCRLVLAALCLAAASAHPAAAQSSFATYTGCNVYFCTLVSRTDFVVVPGEDYGYAADIQFTLRQPFVDAAPDMLLGRVGFGDNDWHDYEDAGFFFFDPTGSGVGDVLRWAEGGRGRTPLARQGAVIADLSSPDGFSDHVETLLVQTPEPATLALVAGGLLALGLHAKRRRP